MVCVIANGGPDKQTRKWESEEKGLSTYEDKLYYKVISENTQRTSNNLSVAIKSAIRKKAKKKDLEPIEQYARMLLQSAG